MDRIRLGFGLIQFSSGLTLWISNPYSYWFDSGSGTFTIGPFRFMCGLSQFRFDTLDFKPYTGSVQVRVHLNQAKSWYQNVALRFHMNKEWYFATGDGIMCKLRLANRKDISS